MSGACALAVAAAAALAGEEDPLTSLEEIRSFEVIEASPVDAERIRALASRVADVTGFPAELVRGTEGYRATILDPRSRREVEGLLFLVPLPEPLAGPPPGLDADDVQPLATALRVVLLLDRALRK